MSANDRLDVVAADLTRTAQLDPTIMAFEEMFADETDAAAATLQADADHPSAGLLRGVTIGIKDIFELAGRTPSNGHRAVFDLLERDIPQADAPLVRSLRQAGGMVIGTTKLTELCWYHPTITRNPHDLRCTPGGSSSGSAAAVAAGMVQAAVGSQTNGSIVRPASYCGVYGFKPSIGRVDITGMTRISLSFDHPGFFARDARTLAAVARAASIATSDDDAAPIIGVVDLTAIPGVDAEVRLILDRYVGQLFNMGYTIVPIQLPDLLAPETFEAFINVLAPELHSLHDGLLSPGLVDHLGKETREILHLGASTSGEQRVAAERACTALRTRVTQQFDECDLLLLPAATSAAPEGLGSTGSPAMSTLSSLTGVPVGVVPAGGHSRSCLPIGVQVWGRRGDDAAVLAALHRLPAQVLTPAPSPAGS